MPRYYYIDCHRAHTKGINAVQFHFDLCVSYDSLNQECLQLSMNRQGKWARRSSMISHTHKNPKPFSQWAHNENTIAVKQEGLICMNSVFESILIDIWYECLGYNSYNISNRTDDTNLTSFFVSLKIFLISRHYK